MEDGPVVIILASGTITFVNEWLHTKTLNWKVPVATFLLAAVFAGVTKIDVKASYALSVMVLIGALTTEFGGQSAASTVAGIFNPAAKLPPGATKVKEASNG